MRASFAIRVVALPVIVAAFFGLPAIALADFRLQARVDPESAAPGSTVVYELAIESSGNNPPTVPPPTFPAEFGFSPARSEGVVSQQTTIINGAMTNTVRLRYSFSVSKEGSFVLPPVGFEYNGRQYQSNSVALKVRQPQAPAGLPAELKGRIIPPKVPERRALEEKLNGVIFVLPVIDTSTPREGQQILATLYLGFDKELTSKLGFDLNRMQVSDIRVPEFRNFIKDVVNDVPTRSLQLTPTMIGNREYIVLPFYRVALTATKTGPVSMEQAAVELLLPARGAMANDPFANDPFFNDPMFRELAAMRMMSNSLRVFAVSPEVTVDVKPLPTAGRPANFSNAVGEFNVSAKFDKTSVRANDDIVKLEVKIEGQGDPTGVNAPKLDKLEGLTLLEEPKAKSERRVENDKLISTKTFQYIFRATKPGALSLPPVTLPFFSPSKDTYLETESEPLTLNVEPGSGNAALVIAQGRPASGTRDANTPPQSDAATTAKQDAAAGPKDLNYIRTGEMRFVSRGALTADSAEFWALAGAPLIIIAAAGLLARRPVKARARQRKPIAAAARIAARSASATETYASEAESEKLCNALSATLRNFVADVAATETARLTQSELLELLESQQLADPQIRAFSNLIERCEASRYGATPLSATAMQTLRHDVQSWLAAQEEHSA